MSSNQPYNEQALLQRTSQGDEAAFALLYKHYVPYMRPFLIRISGSAADADEVIQETFLRVWLSRDQLTEITHFRGWLFTIASKQNLYRLRKELRMEEKAARLATHGAALSLVNAPVLELEMREIKVLVMAAVKNLSAQRRKIYQLSRDQGYTAAQIADKLNLSTQTVNNTLSAALKQIREHLERFGYPLSLMICLLLNLF